MLPAMMIEPAIIQHSKTDDTYETPTRSITMKCKLGNATDLLAITDGELALTAAILNILKICALLKCTRYFENNCKDH